MELGHAVNPKFPSVLSLTVGNEHLSAFKPDGLPSELTQQIPQLADYGYSKMKDQILLVDEMTGKIADIIPETTGK